MAAFQLATLHSTVAAICSATTSNDATRRHQHMTTLQSLTSCKALTQHPSPPLHHRSTLLQHPKCLPPSPHQHPATPHKEYPGSGTRDNDVPTDRRRRTTIPQIASIAFSFPLHTTDRLTWPTISANRTRPPVTAPTSAHLPPRITSATTEIASTTRRPTAQSRTVHSRIQLLHEQGTSRARHTSRDKA